MKKLIALCTFISISFGNVLACKNETTLYQISDVKKSNRAYFVQDLISDGECKMIYEYEVIYKGTYTSKIRIGSNTFYTLTAFIKY